MKRTLLSALTLLVASTAIAPVASAVESTNFNIQATRLEALDARTKTTVEHKIQVEYLNNQTKAIEDIQGARLEALDARTKNSVHKLRLEHLNNQTKAVEDIQSTRLEALDARSKAVDNIQAARLNALDVRTKSIIR
ncbi:MAG: hypothetical protein KTR27_09230 [Leptolyngbyaceae cyanobacterium MAG.088]|nr:hypothetical protein [Leptolyngbyaceae cyanobacterium MAG.088]